jgi:hypothetical protein
VSAKPVGGGVLAGGVVSIFGTVDLSAGGKADWVHWPSNAHKATGSSQIGKYTMIGTKGATTYTGTRALTWRDGTPSATGSSKQGVSTSGAGNGFQVRAPADTQARMLTVYATLVNTAGKLSVRLSDGSAPEYVTLVRQPAWRASGRYDMAFLISYRAASAGQSVTVTWTQNGKAGNGSVGLQGATLATTGQ